MIRIKNKEIQFIAAIEIRNWDIPTLMDLNRFMWRTSKHELEKSKGQEILDKVAEDGYLTIEVCDGTNTAYLGDYIIKGTDGNFYISKPDTWKCYLRGKSDCRKEDL